MANTLKIAFFLILCILVGVNNVSLANIAPGESEREGGGDERKRVVGAFSYSTPEHTVNFGDMYGDSSNVHVFLADMSSSVIFNVEDYNTEQTIPVLIAADALIMRAYNSWRRSGYGFQRVSSTPPLDPSFPGVITRIVESPENTLAWTNINSGGVVGQTTININRRFFESHGLDNYYRARELGYIPMRMGVEEYINMLFYLTILHESGHSLGLGHPDFRGNPISYEWRQIVPPTPFRQRPSIMLSGLSEGQYFIGNLSRHLGRPISIDDINISNNDIQGASIMRVGGVPANISNCFVSLVTGLLLRQSR